MVAIDSVHFGGWHILFDISCYCSLNVGLVNFVLVPDIVILAVSSPNDQIWFYMVSYKLDRLLNSQKR